MLPSIPLLAAATHGAQKAPSVYQVVIGFLLWLLVAAVLNPWVVSIYAVVAGLFWCFLTYRYLSVSIVFWGIVYGAIIGGIKGWLTPDISQAWLAGHIVIGAAAGVGVLLLFYQALPFLLGALWAAAAVSVVLRIVPVPYVSGIVLLGAFAIGGWLAWKRRDTIYIVSSSICGAESVVLGVIIIVYLVRAPGSKLAEILAGLAGIAALGWSWGDADTKEKIVLVVVRSASTIVLASLGMYVQFRLRSGEWWAKVLRQEHPDEIAVPSICPGTAPESHVGYRPKGGLPVDTVTTELDTEDGRRRGVRPNPMDGTGAATPSEGEGREE